MQEAAIGCSACRQMPDLFPFTMAFQPVVDLQDHRIDAHEALVRGPNGEGAASVLAQLNAENLYAFDQACRIKAIELAARLKLGCQLNINFLPNAVYEPRACIRWTRRGGTASRCSGSPSNLPKASRSTTCGTPRTSSRNIAATASRSRWTTSPPAIRASPDWPTCGPTLSSWTVHWCRIVTATACGWPSSPALSRSAPRSESRSSPRALSGARKSRRYAPPACASCRASIFRGQSSKAWPPHTTHWPGLTSSALRLRQSDRATVLVRGKWQVIAMLVPSAKSGRDCAWLRSRRAQARGAFAPPCAPRPLKVVEAPCTRPAPISLPVSLGLVKAIADYGTATAGGAADTLRPAVLAHQSEAPGIVDQRREVDQIRDGHDATGSSRETVYYPAPCTSSQSASGHATWARVHHPGSRKEPRRLSPEFVRGGRAGA